MKNILITGFAPFGGEAVNASWLAVQALPESIDGAVLYKMELPTVFAQAAALAADKAREIRADAILCVGVAAGRSAVTPERIAVNIRDARIADNAGCRPVDEFVAADGPAAYFSTLPAEEICRNIRLRGIDARVSNSAGTYVCNDVFYTLLHAFRETSVKVGFIHVPQLPRQGTPSMEPATVTEALLIAIKSI